LAWVVCEWAAAVRPRIIILENVAEFKDWGPLLKCGTPDPKSKGETFQAFTRRLRALGYTLEHQLLRANDYGAPTIRKRLFLVARCDQQPIHWPKPTHNHPQGLPARTAAECIDWSIACPSIFSRKKPLAANTLKRIAKGIARYVQGTHQPFIVTLAHGEGSGKTQRWGSGVRGLDQPLPTITASSATYGLVCAFLAQHNTMPEGGIHAGRDLLQPFSTITASGAQQQLVTAILDRAHPQQDSHLAEIIHLLSQNDLLEGSASVWIKGIQYNIVDIGMRMLAPHELAAAQGFPPNYILSQTPEGKTLSKAAQIRLIGNSVCPPVAEALVRANFEATL
jgi:DNA (cytosine-5)-methyltransferase 1